MPLLRITKYWRG